MTGKDGGIVGQTEEARLDALAERCIAAAWEIGAPNATAEKRIASEHPALHFGIEANATLGMPRCADDLQGALPYLDDFAVLQVAVGQPALATKRHPKKVRVFFGTIEIGGDIGMSRYRNTIALLHGAVAKNMVEVAVRIDDQKRFQPMTVDETEKLVFLGGITATWVDDDTFLGLLVVNNISVF